LNLLPQTADATFGALARLIPTDGTVLLIGNYGSRNLGDEAILWAILHYLNNVHRRRATFVVPSRQPEEVGRFLGRERTALRPCPIASLRDLLTSLRQSDLVLIGGGGIFSAYTGPLARGVPLFAVLARMLGKQVAYFGLGFYDTAPAWLRALANLSFLTANLIVLRDRPSLHPLWQPVRRSPRTLLGRDLVLYLEEPIRQGAIAPPQPDPALAEVAARMRLWRQEGHPVIAISLKPTQDGRANERILTETALALRAWEHQGARFALFPFAITPVWYEDDLSFLTALTKRADLPSDRYLMVPQSHPFYWLRLLQEEVCCMVAMRFHAQIFAHLAHVPFYALAYERKNEGFLDEQGHFDRCRAEEVRAETLQMWAAPLLAAIHAKEEA
jgi:polysaccharide pyruvyl transferase WcaK-like protein